MPQPVRLPNSERVPGRIRNTNDIGGECSGVLREELVGIRHEIHQLVIGQANVQQLLFHIKQERFDFGHEDASQISGFGLAQGETVARTTLDFTSEHASNDRLFVTSPQKAPGVPGVRQTCQPKVSTPLSEHALNDRSPLPSSQKVPGVPGVRQPSQRKGPAPLSEHALNETFSPTSSLKGPGVRPTSQRKVSIHLPELNDRFSTTSGSSVASEMDVAASPSHRAHLEKMKTKQKVALRRMFRTAEEVDSAETQKKLSRRTQNVLEQGIALTSEQKKNRVEMVTLTVIVLNTMFTGIAMDYDDGSAAWTITNAIFSAFFFIEFGIKIQLFGLGHFKKFINFLDALLVLADLTQIVLESLYQLDGAPPASLFRVIRIFRLSRMVRLLRIDFFSDFSAMVQGIVGGVKTLAWAMVLFFLVVYIVALFFRESLGREEKQHIYELFNSVPRAVFTTFRCSFGDCSSASGVPIFEHVYTQYGIVISLVYTFFVFGITIGLFNVISAIFVESTLSAAQALETKQRRERHQDEGLLFSLATAFIRRLLVFSDLPDDANGPLSDLVDDLVDLEVDVDVIDRVVRDEQAKAALTGLDIQPADFNRLSDIFDPDNGGTVTVGDVATGIRRLRGDPRRSDIICIDLMVRSMQHQIAEVHQLSRSNNRRLCQFLALYRDVRKPVV